MTIHDPNRRDLDAAFDLEEVLGARSRVAVLREMVRVPERVWPAWLANWTGMSRSTVWDALHRLGDAGVVEPAAFDPRRQVPWRIPPGHPLEGPLARLFEAERVSRLTDRQRRAERARVEATWARLARLSPLHGGPEGQARGPRERGSADPGEPRS